MWILLIQYKWKEKIHTKYTYSLDKNVLNIKQVIGPNIPHERYKISGYLPMFEITEDRGG